MRKHTYMSQHQGNQCSNQSNQLTNRSFIPACSAIYLPVSHIKQYSTVGESQTLDPHARNLVMCRPLPTCTCHLYAKPYSRSGCRYSARIHVSPPSDQTLKSKRSRSPGCPAPLGLNGEKAVMTPCRPGVEGLDSSLLACA